MSTDLLNAVRHYADLQQGKPPFATAIEGVSILRHEQETRPNPTILKPALCIVVQGAKWTTFGDRRYEYRAGQALVVSIEMPSFGRVIEASPTEPFLGVVIELDLAVMRKVMEGLHTLPKPIGNLGPSVFVTNYSGPLADSALRMMRLLETPQAIPMLYPGIMQEICYWLLTGPQGGEIFEMTMKSSHAQRVIKAIHVLRDRFATPVRIEELAEIAQMSASAFHRQFKTLTSMTPLQYQKQLRLLEARRLMVSYALKPDTAAFQVGYESPSQFSREYARMFGAPPRRDTLRMLART